MAARAQSGSEADVGPQAELFWQDKALFIVSRGCYFSAKNSHIHFSSISSAGSDRLPN